MSEKKPKNIKNKKNTASKGKKSSLLLSVKDIIGVADRDAYGIMSDGGGSGRSDNNDG